MGRQGPAEQQFLDEAGTNRVRRRAADGAEQVGGLLRDGDDLDLPGFPKELGDRVEGCGFPPPGPPVMVTTWIGGAGSTVAAAEVARLTAEAGWCPTAAARP